MRLLIVLFLFLHFHAAGQKMPGSITTRAVIIGVSKYKNLDASLQLEYADRDAKSFYDFTIAGGFGVAEKENIQYFSNEGAEYEQIRRATLMALFPKNFQEGDQTIIYFAGHGDVQSEFNSPFLLAYDAPINKDYHLDGAWEIEELEKNIARASSRGLKVILIVDACRSGKIISQMGSKMALQALTKEWDNVIKVVSCGPDQSSLENSKWGGGHGVFTYFLLKAFQGLADSDKDKKIRVFELNEFMSKNVREETNFRQIPKCSGPDTKVVVEVLPTIESEKDNGKFKAEKDRKRGISNLFSNPYLTNSSPVSSTFYDEKLTDDTSMQVFNRAIRSGYYARPFLSKSIPMLADTFTTVRLPNVDDVLDFRHYRQDHVFAIYKTGAYRAFSIKDGRPLNVWSFGTPIHAGGTNERYTFYTEEKTNKLWRFDMISKDVQEMDWKDPKFNVRKIVVSPSGKYVILLGGSNGLVVFDVQKKSEIYRRSQVWVYLPDKIFFNTKEDHFLVVSAHKNQPVLFYNTLDATGKEQPRELYRFPKDIEDGSFAGAEIYPADFAVIVLRNNATDTISLISKDSKPVQKNEHWDLATIEIRNGLIRTRRMENGAEMVIPIKQYSPHTEILALSSDLFVLKNKDFFQGVEIVRRPAFPADELLKEIPESSPNKENASALLASIFESYGSQVLNEYLASGKIPVDSAANAFSLQLLQKAILLYNDSMLAENARKRSYFLKGLTLALSQDQQKRDSARSCFEILKSRYPKASFPLNALAELHNAGSEPEKAREFLSGALKLTPKWAVPKHNLGKSNFIEGKLETARQQLERILMQPDFTAEAGIQLIEIYRRNGDIRRAKEILKRVKTRYAFDPDVIVKSAHLYGDQGIYWRAWKELFKVHKQIPFYPSMVLALMEIPGKSSDKWYFLKKSIDLNPGNMALKFHAVLFLMNSKNQKLPKYNISEYLLSLETSGWKPETVSALKEMYAEFKTGKPVTAKFMKVLEGKSIWYQDLFELAKNMEIQNQKSLSIPLVESIANQNNSEPSNWLYLSNLYTAEKQPQKAGQSLEKARKLLKKTNQKDTTLWFKVPEFEEKLRNHFKTRDKELAAAAYEEVTFTLLDSLIHYRDACRISTGDEYLSQFIDLGDKRVRVFLSGKRNKEGLGIYKMRSQSNLGFTVAEARILIQEGNLKKGQQILNELADSEPDNALIFRLLYDSEAATSHQKKKYQSRFLQNAYNSSGSGKASSILTGSQTIITDPAHEEHKLLVPYQIEKIFHPSANLPPVMCALDEKGEKFLIFQNDYASAIPGHFQEVSELAIQNPGQPVLKLLAVVKVAGKWGIKQRDGSWFLEPIYDKLYVHTLGRELFFELWKAELLGIANGNGQISIPVEYAAILWENGKRGLFSKNKEEECIEFQTGKRLGPHCEIAKPANGDFRSFKPTDFSKTYIFGLRSARYYTKYGYVDKTEHFVIPPEYDEAGDFTEVDGKVIARVKMGQYEGFINKSGASVIPIKYKESNIFFERYLVDGKTKSLLIVKKGSLFGIIDSDNEEVVPFNYEDIISLTRFKNTTIFVARQEEEYGAFDLSGKLLLPRLFYSVKIIGAGKFELAGDEARYEYDLETNTMKEIIEKIE